MEVQENRSHWKVEPHVWSHAGLRTPASRELRSLICLMKSLTESKMPIFLSLLRNKKLKKNTVLLLITKRYNFKGFTDNLRFVICGTSVTLPLYRENVKWFTARVIQAFPIKPKQYLLTLC
jgi:hypothetical protein